MITQTRIIKALKGEIPDRVPYFEIDISPQVVKEISDKETFTEKEISRCMHRDHIVWWGYPDPFVQRQEGKNGIQYQTEGVIKNEDDLKIMDHMPCVLTLSDGRRELVKCSGPEDKQIYDSAGKFIKEKEEFAAVAMVNLGIDCTMRSMGVKGFSYALYDNPDLIKRVLDKYVEWNCVIIEKLINIGFDFFCAADDLAFDTGPFFSPQTFRDLILPRIKQVAEKMTIPWIFHSDGNLIPIMDDLLTLGMNGLHPIDPNCMDIIQVKRDYGKRVCVVGNVDLNLLSNAEPDEVEEEVRRKIEALAPGGGYIISSGNSIPGYVKVENVKRMVEAILKYGQYK